MNQILMIENKKKKKKEKKPKMHRTSTEPIEIKNIIRFFAIVIIIFGLTIIGHSSYAIYRESKGNNTEDLAEISMSRINDTLIVNVSSVYTIDYFKYYWQDSEITSIPEENTEFQEEIVLPSENNVLTIILEDETGRAVTYTKEVILDGIDIAKPTIDISKQETSIRITSTDETAIEYMIYKIDNGQEVRIDKNNEGDTTIEYALTGIERGEHTIYVTAVDSSGNTETTESNVIVSSDRPTLKNLRVDQETGKIIIEAADTDGLKSIEVNLNGRKYTINDINKTEATFGLDLINGTNTISIKITNVNGLTAEGSTEFNYAG